MKLSFCDFWDGFDANNNPFLFLFRDVFGDVEVVAPHDSEVLLYSCFGNSHHSVNKNKTTKIFYTGENLRPNFDECRFSLTFDFPDYGGKNIRFPLWLYQIDFFNKKGFSNPSYVIPFEEINENKWTKKEKTKFCCGIWNNPEKKRVETQMLFSQYRPFDLYGKTSGNWFYGEEQKLDVLSDYKFSVCYENTIYPGYYTEKLIHAKAAGTIPLYCAGPECYNEFNKNAFLNLNDAQDLGEFFAKVLVLDKDDGALEQMRQEKLFIYDDYPKELLEDIKFSLKRMLS